MILHLGFILFVLCFSLGSSAGKATPGGQLVQSNTRHGDGSLLSFSKGSGTAKETHNAGPWAGWSVERVADTKGRLKSLEIRSGGTLKNKFDFGYDAYSRLSGSTSANAVATYAPRTPTGALNAVTRRHPAAASGLTSAWSYDPGIGRLSGLTNSFGQAAIPGYTYAGYYLLADSQIGILHYSKLVFFYLIVCS
ncbi:MAG: hypothetical protein V4710_02275 [Verrucomicrobiota bacterium]